MDEEFFLPALQRFRRAADAPAARGMSDAEWDMDDGIDSGDDEGDGAGGRDGTFKPIYAYWMEKGLIPARNMRPGGASVRRGRNQVIIRT